MAKLDRKTLEEKIALRAKSQTETRIKAFKVAACRAAGELLGKQVTPNTTYGVPYSADVRTLFAVLASDTPNKGWPRELWDADESRVTDEIMATMNELQRVLLVKDDAFTEEPEPLPETDKQVTTETQQ